jgi:hypothetical protein
MYNRGTTVNNTYKELEMNKLKVIDTNKTGDYVLVRPNFTRFDLSVVIATKAGSIICKGQRDYVLKKWKTLKNT